ncbi:UDP-N-acetylglucosamine 2-epimerase (non-hydrolyzing) [Paraburkholderia sp. GAS333]|uniref:non-hydrolyzing UDP-N-acetylglucosamine 2-epimerase n=1 Tax=Paraburkholderia sp. GAS333 TaxID=3156279 RepID=UPI003D1A7FA2
MTKKILSIFGTRPEAIKMAPLMRALAAEPGIDSVVCITGQHHTMLQQVLDLFDIAPDYDLAVMTQNQTLNSLTARVIEKLDKVIDREKPDRILVHGDTTSASSAALAAFHRRIPVGHVEAGLRTYDPGHPWPEEINRRIVDTVSDLLFVPTHRSAANIAAESLQGSTIVTGNTVIDALLWMTERIDSNTALRDSLDARFPFLDPGRQMVLVTGHRRESFGQGFADICAALTHIAQRPDVQIVYPVHLNPNVRGPVTLALERVPNIHLIEPQGYDGFVRLLQRATLILTDSGGVQEEAPALGKPVLVMRDVTERPEAVQAGTALLVGTNPATIVNAVMQLLDDAGARHAFAQRINPYGDGRASARIVAALAGRPFDAFAPPGLRSVEVDIRPARLRASL